ncbi:MAG: hypothetical protein AAFX41_00725 [Bacteroidota bacterium]
MEDYSFAHLYLQTVLLSLSLMVGFIGQAVGALRRIVMGLLLVLIALPVLQALWMGLPNKAQGVAGLLMVLLVLGGLSLVALRAFVSVGKAILLGVLSHAVYDWLRHSGGRAGCGCGLIIFVLMGVFLVLCLLVLVAV